MARAAVIVFLCATASAFAPGSRNAGLRPSSQLHSLSPERVDRRQIGAYFAGGAAALLASPEWASAKAKKENPKKEAQKKKQEEKKTEDENMETDTESLDEETQLPKRKKKKQEEKDGNQEVDDKESKAEKAKDKAKQKAKAKDKPTQIIKNNKLLLHCPFSHQHHRYRY